MSRRMRRAAGQRQLRRSAPEANASSPIFSELRGIVLKTVGLVEPLREALEPLADRIELAFVFGSVAKLSDHGASDVDLLVISDTLGYGDVFEALQSAEKQLARAVNPTVYTRAEWKCRRSRTESFTARIAGEPRIVVLGGDDD